MHNGAFHVCLLARSHVVTTAHVHRKTCRERGRAFLPSHYLLFVLSLFPLLFSSSLSPSLPCFLRTSIPLCSTVSSLCLPSSLVRPLSIDHVREGILSLSSFYSSSRPVIVDTMVRNDCFTPPLARELGNKLATGLISLSRRMAAPHPA